MKIAVIAATGRLGRVFVEEALKAGHEVRTDQCDATKLEDVRNLLKGQEVVVSALGHVKTSAPNVQTVATKNIISAMHELGIARYIDVTGTGVRFPDDKISLVDRVLNFAVEILDPSRVKDGRSHQDLLIASDLDWTTIRVLKLQNTAPKAFQLTPHGPTKWYVGRREVAQAILQVIEQNSFIKQAPILSDKISA